MRIDISGHTIEALAQVISGGPSGFGEPIGIYRTAYELKSWFAAFGLDLDEGPSRVSSVRSTLSRVFLSHWDDELSQRIIERAADPRDFLGDPVRQRAVVDHLNERLEFDGLKLEFDGKRVRLVELEQHSGAVVALTEKVEAIGFDTVKRDVDRALAAATSDPEDAVTAACSIVESVCRSILVDLQGGLPAKRDLSGLYRAVQEPLGLSPTKDGIPDEIAEDVRNALSGLVTAVRSIGALRTHGGDAHGREKGFRRVDTRIARLAVYSASAIALFLIETWEMKHPGEKLARAISSD
ncbi:abortive infection family protein [Pelagibacterium flavum]|uniref:Abortive infection family protein n=1 Tax=Pelagibacterium flavum TaxID=2984530 RepID=A0ABY6IVL7_9HYPH|nr:abortive infection family protein [Pelagibacterium sp. YIM 151497]UYQ73464.1 abortive infection family protein [Pelagibacterium sp. YIM 151497]